MSAQESTVVAQSPSFARLLSLLSANSPTCSHIYLDHVQLLAQQHVVALQIPLVTAVSVCRIALGGGAGCGSWHLRSTAGWPSSIHGVHKRAGRGVCSLAASIRRPCIVLHCIGVCSGVAWFLRRGVFTVLTLHSSSGCRHHMQSWLEICMQ